MKNHGKRWQNRITLEWADNPPRENSKANNRMCRELRKSLVRLAGAHDRESPVFEDKECLLLDCNAFVGRVPRSLVVALVDDVNEIQSDQAAAIGASYTYEKYNRYSSYRATSK